VSADPWRSPSPRANGATAPRRVPVPASAVGGSPRRTEWGFAEFVALISDKRTFHVYTQGACAHRKVWQRTRKRRPTRTRLQRQSRAYGHNPVSAQGGTPEVWVSSLAPLEDAS
jgi:hypothetical protein